MSCCCASGVTQTHAPVPSTRSGPLAAGSSYSGDMLPPPDRWRIHTYCTFFKLWWSSGSRKYDMSM